MAETLDSFLQLLAVKCQAIVDEAAKGSASGVKTLIGTPVDRFPGGVVIRSAPGQPPRRDTGELQANVKAEPLLPLGNTLAVAAVSSSKPSEPSAPRVLEFGGWSNFGPIAARPYMTVGMEMFAIPLLSTAIQRLKI